MSEATIARWKAIPMERPSQPSTPPRNLKRTRSLSDSEDEGNDRDDDDDLVSRSPSPKPRLDSTMQKVYNEHMRGIDEEIVTLETKIRNTNIGYAMLQKLGWKDGEGLGAHGQGRAEPIPFELKNDSLGLGKANLDHTVIEATVSQRRDLDSERLLRETEEQRRAREDKVAKQAAIKTEVTAVLKPFYCDLCDKQYQTVAQYDEHCNSYAHHHKVREKDLRAAARVGKDSASVRQEKERKREEKELKKMAKVHGIKLTTPSQVAPLAAATTTVSPGAGGGWSSAAFSSLTPAVPIAPATTSGASKGFKSGGWAAVGSAPSLALAPNPPAKAGGWTTVGSASTSSAPPPANPPPPNEPAPPPPPPPPSTNKAPAFRSSGWTQMDHLTDVKTIVDTEPLSVNTHPHTSMDYEMDHTPPPPRPPSPPSMPPPPPPVDLSPHQPVHGPPPAVSATPHWRTHFAPSPSPSAFGQRGAQSRRDRSPVWSTGLGGDGPWTHNPSSPSAPRRPSRQDKR